MSQNQQVSYLHRIVPIRNHAMQPIIQVMSLAIGPVGLFSEAPLSTTPPRPRRAWPATYKADSARCVTAWAGDRRHQAGIGYWPIKRREAKPTSETNHDGPIPPMRLQALPRMPGPDHRRPAVECPSPASLFQPNWPGWIVSKVSGSDRASGGIRRPAARRPG